MASDNGTEIRVLAATGVCGSGFREASLAEAMRRQPHFIGCDCGSTDPGPYPLGAGTTAFPRVAIKRDLRLMLLAARQAGIPLLLGSAGTAGGVPYVAVVKDILSEIAAEEGLSFPLALIRSKNAGPFELTFDIMFAKPAVYERVREAGALSREVVAAHYSLPPDEVKFFVCDNALAFKASIPRPNFQGDLFDRDNHGGQQNVPLMDIEIPGL